MFTLPQLSYSYDALEPYIDAKTMEIHLQKHHQAYIDNLNKAIEGHTDLKKYSLEELLINLSILPDSIKAAVQNHGGGHYNHSLFWQMMKPNGKQVSGLLSEEIQKQFGNIESFKDTFGNAAKTRFGSGWAWLIVNKKGDLEICSTANQDSPLTFGNRVILGLDVWEHAYYLHYQNRRPDYIQAWWNIVNWEFAEEQYRMVIGK